MVKVSEFQEKDVVNILDGKNLGQVTDLEINLQAGRVEAIVVPGKGNGKFFGFFGGGEDITIPWRNIVKIGRDVILVRLDDMMPFTKPEAAEGGYRP
ncbi:YlmC/YmxH family sporulation protein [Aneurinibacillus migulanus]|uniref:Sporulation protein, YlmC/YmxH family n=1 Tax=Aneurinibacillus migulanus TaxID=47500 RepID=A0A0D1X7E4_ANEMI|nr:YlmC/YmxH family sporulation protein [Aneurinibacillus migulanus]KIV50431.1 YlmC/YmxH family sporulation protein [Aneurinibacillus migulanus]KIV55696.1 YlmC/YmxH family sporulation protein [Aneurinibacillus migulanus]KON95681.1 YlmC/YmxH family sporulation protein [Aneurinibacillus migulanus]KPD05061.1 YlmC/YmxH family sporulation protein [Aneurinibacillus migulanus]MCP1355689.1 YlmC/YmxH family sporulation protein [Aneurinibacillus migulanus]